MNDRPSDLLTLIVEARRLVPDDRYVWCVASDTFDSRLIERRGLLLGGAFSPHFLRDATAMWWEIPWMVRLRRCRVAVCDQAAQEPLAAWLPLMESVAAASEALLVVAETIDSELLSTFVVNAVKGTLPVCAVRPIGGPSGGAAPGARFDTPPAGPDKLPLIDEVWIRRTATACYPKAGDALASAATLQRFAVIETGGENHEDQYDRLRFLMQELQQPDGG